MKNSMQINHEVAMLLWTKSFGKDLKAKDFAGREMLKAAYNDRNSEYGWNLDHILPQSRGGKTTESNLICCHILTNDEKGDKFPCFTANGKKFEIVKVQNHYEIREIKRPSDSDGVDDNNDESVNFFDSAAGIRYFKSLKGIQNKKVFIRTVVIMIKNMKSTALIDFIKEIFADKNLSFSGDINSTEIVVNDFDMPLKENTADLLDRCVLLNTYLSKYFVRVNEISGYSIFYGENSGQDKLRCYSTKIDCGYLNEPWSSDRHLLINSLVRENSDKAKNRVDEDDYIGYDSLGNKVYEYNYIYTNLAENLEKIVK